MSDFPYSIKYVAGDTLPGLSGVVLEDDGETPADISLYSVALHVDQETPLVKQAVIPTGTDGVFEFAFLPGELETGSWLFEIQITSPSGILTIQTNPDGKRLRLLVDAEIA